MKSEPNSISLFPDVIGLWCSSSLWWHHCVKANLKKKKKKKSYPPSSLFLLPRPNLLRANRVVFFCQQSFLKEIFFQRNLFLFNFCMVVWGNALPLSSLLSLFLPPLVSVSSVESSRCSFKLTLTSRGCFLFVFVFLCFTFCKLNESKQKIHTKRTL